MPRRCRPEETSRSEHWLRVAVNVMTDQLSAKVAKILSWSETQEIQWISPLKNDQYAEYWDQAFLDILGLSNLKIPLKSFWPAGGPRWDGLGKTESGRVVLVEAKAYIEEAVDYQSKASSDSFKHIKRSICETKNAFRAYNNAPWEKPFYQHVNRLAHLYFLAELNNVDAFLIFLLFANAPDVPNPCTHQQWEGAIRLTNKCLGLGKHPFQKRIGYLIWDISEMLSHDHRKP
jgi:hypothetical protein